MGLTSDGRPSTLFPSRGPAAPADAPSRDFDEALADLADRWERGDEVPAEAYLHRGRPWPAEQAVELIYREYRLARAAGLAPARADYLERFPEHRRALERLLDLDDACPDSLLGRLGGPEGPGDDPLPRAGDEIGPYVLDRELGRGAFARVFLARQADLEDRPVVIKITTKPTREPWLLARARHPNIVEILTHAEVDDGALQLIAMPFLGGAALSTVLARRRERAIAAGDGPAPDPRGRGYLDDLDAVSAREHAPAGAPGPARSILRAMADAHALAWSVARLAEALDHARRRGVAHGDVKPSNVLITADGAPMLLDFNLAQDWSKIEPGAAAADVGGTLAYMAPERLAALAADPGGRPAPPDDDRAHRADVYSLGLVLLEALTGWSPSVDADAPRRPGPAGLREAARLCAATRERGAWVVRRAEAAAGRRLPAGLRVVLAHCLQADPEARHGRGLDLAEDLDRWRADRPLAFAPEPSRLHAAAKWARRRRRPLAGLASALALGGSAALGVALYVNQGRDHEVHDRRQAIQALTNLYDDPSNAVFGSRHQGQSPRRRDPQEITREARGVLTRYQVLGEGDWRLMSLFRMLPQGEREDLELFLLEQALRYGRVLALLHGASPEDWRRARKTVDRACGPIRPAALRNLRERLTAQIGDGDPGPASPPSPTPRAIDAYLDGVAAEIDGEERPEAAADAARRAADRYRELVALRPSSFWGRYRAAVVAFSLSRWDEVQTHLQFCSELRPGNPLLRLFLAGNLDKLDRDDEALEQCNLAIAAAPDRAEFVQTRAFIRADSPGLDSLDSLEWDIRRYEVLRSVLPKRFLLAPQGPADGLAGTGANLPLTPPTPEAVPSASASASDEAVEVGRGELEARAVLASKIREAGSDPDGPARVPAPLDPRRLALADFEVEKILALDPNNLVAQVDRMCLAISRERPLEAKRHLDRVIADPRLLDYARFAPERLDALHYACILFAAHEQFAEAHALAFKILDLAKAGGGSRGRAYYTLAVVEAGAAASNRKWLRPAGEHLGHAILAHPKYGRWFQRDPAFDPVRIQLRAALDARAAASPAGRP